MMRAYYIVFGFDQVLSDKYTVVWARDITEARERAHRVYGNLFLGVYDNPEEPGINKWQLQWVPFGTPNKRKEVSYAIRPK